MRLAEKGVRGKAAGLAPLSAVETGARRAPNRLIGSVGLSEAFDWIGVYARLSDREEHFRHPADQGTVGVLKP